GGSRPRGPPEPPRRAGAPRERPPQVPRHPGPDRRRRRGRSAAARGAPPAVSSVVMLNAAGALLDEAVREGHGARPALRTSTGEVSYADLLAQVQRAAAGLRARGGGRGGRGGRGLPCG